MDWSDDVAYSVHDFEDALVSGQVRLHDLKNDLPELFRVAQESFVADLSQPELEAALANLQQLSCWPASYLSLIHISEPTRPY